MKWTKIKWNKANTMILLVMILVVMGIGKQAKQQDKEEIGQQETVTEAQNISQTEIKEDQPNSCKNTIMHISMDTYGGSGIIVDIIDGSTNDQYERQIIIATCKHLLQEMGNPKVVIADNIYEAEVIGMSEQYDLGFIQVVTKKEQALTYERFEQATFPKTQQDWKEATYLGTDVYQYSAKDKDSTEYYEGYVSGYEFIPEFNNDMLVTKCYAQAGMSGGGVFDETGILLGMISGGADPNESEFTYCLPSYIIQEEFAQLNQE